MNPAIVALIVGLIEEAVKVTPGLVADLQAIFAKPDPTPDDWQALRDKIQAPSYADYVPASDLTPENIATVAAKAISAVVGVATAPEPDTAALSQPPKVTLVDDTAPAPVQPAAVTDQAQPATPPAPAETPAQPVSEPAVLVAPVSAAHAYVKFLTGK